MCSDFSLNSTSSLPSNFNLALSGCVPPLNYHSYCTSTMPVMTVSLDSFCFDRQMLDGDFPRQALCAVSSKNGGRGRGNVYELRLSTSIWVSAGAVCAAILGENLPLSGEWFEPVCASLGPFDLHDEYIISKGTTHSKQVTSLVSNSLFLFRGENVTKYLFIFSLLIECYCTVVWNS